MTDIVHILRNPPFGTETSERNIMARAADEILKLRTALQLIKSKDTNELDPSLEISFIKDLATTALSINKIRDRREHQNLGDIYEDYGKSWD